MCVLRLHARVIGIRTEIPDRSRPCLDASQLLPAVGCKLELDEEKCLSMLRKYDTNNDSRYFALVWLSCSRTRLYRMQPEHALKLSMVLGPS